MEISVSTLAGQKHSLVVPPEVKCSAVKAELEACLGIPPKEQVLMSDDGVIIDDHQQVLVAISVESADLVSLLLVRRRLACVFALGGYYEGNTICQAIDRFDTQSKEWDQLCQIPSKRVRFAAIMVDNAIYVVGGNEGGDNAAPLTLFERFNLDSRNWEELPAMPTAREAMSAASDGLSMFVIGGQTHDNKTAVVERFDLQAQTWETCPSMPTPRAGLAAVFLDGAIYAIGGVSTDDADLGTVERFCLSKREWTAMNPIRARFHLGAAAATGNIFAVGGGVDADADVEDVETVERLNPADTNAEWKLLTPGLPEPRSFLGVASVADVVYAFGGGSDSSTMYYLDTSARDSDWSEGTPMLRGRRCVVGVAG